MAVCNIFSPLSNPTGNFIMFSNYTDDLNIHRVQSSKYRVVPSKFYVLDVDFTNVMRISNIAQGSDLNIEIPKLFQNKYENWIAYVKDHPELIEDYESSLTGGVSVSEIEFRKRMFWSFLDRTGILYQPDKNKENSNIKYCGNISMESYDTHGNEGYGEIVCHIDSAKNILTYPINFNELHHWMSDIPGDYTYIMGYDENSNIPIDGTLYINQLNPYISDYSVSAITKTEPFEPDVQEVDEDVKTYKFNTIIVYYDILDGSNLIEKDIPMGVYFTGNFDGSDVITNEKTIYIQNKDAFGASTTYSLRICTRYTVNPNTYGIDSDITTDPDDYASVSLLLSKMADTIDAMNDVISSVQLSNVANKELYNIFKSGQVNVPYIKEIDGVYYWFVNGKMLAQLSFEEITPETIDTTYEGMKSVYDRAYRTNIDIPPIEPIEP